MPLLQLLRTRHLNQKVSTYHKTRKVLAITSIDVVGGLYDPRLLPDYSPETFAFEKNKLVQHDVRDIENHLIPAWDIEQGLRPGTVILVSASLHIYNIENKTPSNSGFRRVCPI